MKKATEVMMKIGLQVIVIILICISLSYGESFTQDTGSAGGLETVKGIANTIVFNLSDRHKGQSIKINKGREWLTLFFEKHYDNRDMNFDMWEVTIADTLLGMGDHPFKVNRSGRIVTLSNAGAPDMEFFSLTSCRKGTFQDVRYVKKVDFEAKSKTASKFIYEALVTFFTDANKLTWD